VKRAETDRRSSSEMRESRQHVADAPGVAFAVGPDNRIVAWNAAAREMLGWAAAEAVGRDAAEVIVAKDIFGNRWCPHQCGFREMARSDDPIQTFWVMLRAKDGTFSQFFGSVEVVGNDAGRRGPRSSDQTDLVFRLQRERRRQTAGALIDRLLRRQMSEQAAFAAPQANDGPSTTSLLTPRQIQVLSLLADGHHPAHIAERLGVSVNTVRNHIQRILDNLDVHSQANAVAVAIRQGII
jgi:PAS domain S-box-containing protein